MRYWLNIKKRRIFFEATPLAGIGSGVSHNSLELIRSIHKNENFKKNFDLILLIPFDKAKDVSSKLPEDIKLSKIPIPLIIFNVLWKFNLLPPLDIFYGKGIYIFPNYRNLPLLFSKNITFIHDASFELYPHFVAPKNLKFIKRNIKRWVKRADIVATLTESSLEDLVNNLKIPREKMVVISCGVDTNFFYRRNTQEIKEVLKKLHVNGEYLLFIGNIEPRKNIGGVLDAYERFFKKFPNISLLLIGGDSWLSEGIELKIKELVGHGAKIIRPKFHLDDNYLPALYSGALALIYPSFYEGFGLPPLQAMACGTPIIVSNISSISEVVNGAGIYVDPNSTNSIERAIVKVVDHQHDEEISNRVRVGVKRTSKYPWTNSVTELYRSIETLK